MGEHWATPKSYTSRFDGMVRAARQQLLNENVFKFSFSSVSLFKQHCFFFVAKLRKKQIEKKDDF
jgi:hypothetical protein